MDSIKHKIIVIPTFMNPSFSFIWPSMLFGSKIVILLLTVRRIYQFNPDLISLSLWSFPVDLITTILSFDYSNKNPPRFRILESLEIAKDMSMFWEGWERLRAYSRI